MINQNNHREIYTWEKFVNKMMQDCVSCYKFLDEYDKTILHNAEKELTTNRVLNLETENELLIVWRNCMENKMTQAVDRINSTQTTNRIIILFVVLCGWLLLAYVLLKG